jgi:hypothetical protein
VTANAVIMVFMTMLGGNSLARTVPQTPDDAANSARRDYAMAGSALISTA